MRIVDWSSDVGSSNLSRDTVRFSGPHPDCRVDVGTLTAPLPVCGHCAPSASSTPCAQCLDQRKARLDAYQGELLAGLTLTDAPDFEVWLDARRQGQLGRAPLWERGGSTG